MQLRLKSADLVPASTYVNRMLLCPKVNPVECIGRGAKLRTDVYWGERGGAARCADASPSLSSGPSSRASTASSSAKRPNSSRVRLLVRAARADADGPLADVARQHARNRSTDAGARRRRVGYTKRSCVG